jgi:hypothetical protein
MPSEKFTRDPLPLTKDLLTNVKFLCAYVPPYLPAVLPSCLTATHPQTNELTKIAFRQKVRS